MAGDTGLGLHDEHYFRTWFKRWSERTNVNPDPDHRNSKYDYRKAFMDKAEPAWDEETKTWSWPEEYRVDKPVKYELELKIGGVKLIPQTEEQDVGPLGPSTESV